MQTRSPRQHDITRPSLQETLTITGHPLGHLQRHTTLPRNLPRSPPHTSPILRIAHLTKRKHSPTPRQAAPPLHPQTFPTLQLSLQPQRFLLLLSQLPLGPLSLELVGGIRRLEIVDRLEEPLDLLAGLGDVVRELSVCLVAAVDLRLQVADGAIDVADGAGGFGVLGFLFFDLGFELCGKACWLYTSSSSA